MYFFSQEFEIPIEVRSIENGPAVVLFDKPLLRYNLSKREQERVYFKHVLAFNLAEGHQSPAQVAHGKSVLLTLTADTNSDTSATQPLSPCLPDGCNLTYNLWSSQVLYFCLLTLVSPHPPLCTASIDFEGRQVSRPFTNSCCGHKCG